MRALRPLYAIHVQPGSCELCVWYALASTEIIPRLCIVGAVVARTYVSQARRLSSIHRLQRQPVLNKELVTTSAGK